MPPLNKNNRPQSGPAFWRSLDEYADTPEFHRWLGNEFPPSLFDRLHAVDRRQFLKTMAASFALAGLTGCSGGPPPEDVVPYVRPPKDITPGEPAYYASTLTRDGYGCGVVVQSRIGRPVKIEGNPDHPSSRGATDIFTQAALLGLYDPDRSQAVMLRGGVASWDDLVQSWEPRRAALRANGGGGLRILTGTITSPTLLAQLAGLLRELPAARWHVHDPIDRSAQRAGVAQACGAPADLLHDFSQADIVVALDCDFLFALPGSVRYARQFADRRAARTTAPGAPSEARNVRMSRVYVAEPTPTISGAKADARLPIRATRIADLLRAIAARITGRGESSSDDWSQAERDWLAAATNDLRAARGRGLLLVGDGQPAEVHAAALALNAALGNVGATVSLLPPPWLPPGDARPQDLGALVQDIRAGGVETLLMLDTNPVYDAPADLEFAAALEAVPFSMHLGRYRNETGRRTIWHLPAAHELETWGDARGHDGLASLTQPLIDPLYKGRSAIETLATLFGDRLATGQQLVQDHWRAQRRDADFDAWWRNCLRTGVIADSKPQPLRATIDDTLLARFVRGATRSPGTRPVGEALELVFAPDPTIWAGGYANSGWLQELPKPLSKLTWDNALMISPKTAAQRELGNRDRVAVTVAGRTLEAAIWVQPGQADDVLALSLGYGRGAAGHVGDERGFNAYALRRSARPWIEPDVALAKRDGQYNLVTAQHHHTMEGRDLLRHGTLAQFRDHPHAIAHEEVTQEERIGVPLSILPEWKYPGRQWGMVIDLTRCIGCNACVVACQAENNIPVVGKRQVEIGREMQWIRIDSYYSGQPEAPEIRLQPVPCMHCEKAPCELVCPVGATQHSPDGLNEMVYNRCIGTRYCSNNCPYKVRRFNFLRYGDHHNETLKLLRNPEVTVRGRGVMEKCTYCVQRIRNHEIAAKNADRPLRDNEIQTACQQVCPTEAIIFGDINDPASLVAKAKREPHNYGMLAEFNTQPRTTYLAEVRNPAPELKPPHSPTHED